MSRPMTSRERVLRCVEFDHPDRVPRDLWWLPLMDIIHGPERSKAFRKRWPTDFDTSGSPASGVARLCKGDMYEIGQYVDEWGCTWENIQRGVIGEIKQPLLDDWSKLEDLRPPVEAFDIDVDEVNRRCAATDKFTFCDCIPRPFERMQFLRGSENLFMDLAEESSDFQALLKLVGDYFIQEMEVWARTRVDGLRFMDDWGSQRALLIAPEQWRRLFKPIYRRFAQIAHDAGKKLFMHSDGCIFDIYEDLIEIGVDAVNSQLFCMDLEEIGRRFRGRITFWGEMDRQHILACGTRAEARAAVQRVVDALFQPAGGVIAQFECGSSLESADEVFQAWLDLTASPAAR